MTPTFVNNVVTTIKRALESEKGPYALNKKRAKEFLKAVGVFGKRVRKTLGDAEVRLACSFGLFFSCCFVFFLSGYFGKFSKSNPH